MKKPVKKTTPRATTRDFGILLKALDSFKDLRVLVLGDLLLDTYLLSDVVRISPEAPVPIAHVVEEKFTLGGAANVAHNLCALGVQTELMGCLGDDSAGHRLLDLLKKKRIGHDSILKESHFSTIQKIRIVCQNQQLLRVDRETLSPLLSRHLQTLKTSLQRLIPKMNVVVLSDYAKGFLTESLVRTVIALARKHSIPVVADIKPAHKLFYKGVTVILPNHKEAEQMTNLIDDDDRTLTQMGKKLQKQLGCDVVITRGSKGMRVFHDNRSEDVMTKARQVYDVTGAGDTVTAVIAAGLAKGLSLTEAAQLASFAAGLVVEKFGPATVSAEEIEQKFQSLNSK